MARPRLLLFLTLALAPTAVDALPQLQEGETYEHAEGLLGALVPRCAAAALRLLSAYDLPISAPVCSTMCMYDVRSSRGRPGRGAGTEEGGLEAARGGSGRTGARVPRGRPSR